MVTKGKLKMALAAEKGTDFKKLKEKKKAKETAKRKAAAVVAEKSDEPAIDEQEEDEDEEDDSEDEEEDNGVSLAAIDDSDESDSSVDMEERLPRQPTKKPPTTTKKNGTKSQANDNNDGEDDEEEEEDEEDIPISDLEDLDEEEKEDLIPHTRLTINNTTALLASLNRIALPTDKSVPFATHQCVTSSVETAEAVQDVSDDLQRELAFYSQGLEAARLARSKLRAEGVPFSRPKDYFAEMVKEDAHMDKVKAKLVEEASNKKAAAEARKLRDLKKFGKQVQVAKLQERQKAKRETLEKIKTLKRKRSEAGGDMATNEADLFDVGIEKELGGSSKRGDNNNRSGPGRGNLAGGGNHKRQKKDEKYGFGGKKRHAKSGDAMSSSDLSGFNAKKMKAGGAGFSGGGKGKVSKPTRPGKGRRKAMSGR